MSNFPSRILRFLPRLWLLLAALAVGWVLLWATRTLNEGFARYTAKVRMGGDVEIGRWEEPLPFDLTAFLLFKSKNISRVQEASLTANYGSYYANVSIKGIDTNYPLYGTLQMETGNNIYPFAYDPGQKLHGAVVDKRTLKRLNIKMGDNFTIGRGRFTVTGILIAEPDPATGRMAELPRVIISTQGFRATGVAEDMPERTFFRCRGKLDPNFTLEQVEDEYSRYFPFPNWGWRNADGNTPQN